MAKKQPLALKDRIFGGKTRCAHCRDPFDKVKGWPSRDGLICPQCKSTWDQISDLCK
jgi:hypothetical protein